MADSAQDTAPPPADPRLLVAKPGNGRAVWIFAALTTLAAFGLFSTLEARRSSISSPATAIPQASTVGAIAPPPDIAIPPVDQGYPTALIAPPLLRPVPAIASDPIASPRIVYRQTPSQAMPPAVYAPPPRLGVQPAPGPAFAYRAASGDSAGSLKPDGEESKEADAGVTRVHASRLANPSTTVPQGTLIQAVLETALDSNRAGFARAVISRDVMSFDGSRVLMPKGSKLFGEYKSDLAAGQNRALIQWRRLTRPDGGIIDLNSPSADPVGRAGVKGKVNSHFFARFGGAILESALNIAESAANRSVSGDAFYFSATTNNLSNAVRPQTQEVKPTLTVRQGTSVSVFVARDLDFTEIEG